MVPIRSAALGDGGVLDSATLRYLQATAGNSAVLSLPGFVQRAADDQWRAATAKHGDADIRKEARTLGDDLTAAEQAAGKLRKAAAEGGLIPEKVYTTWLEADKALIVIDSAIVAGKVSDSQRSTAVKALTEFYQAFRAAVASFDVEVKVGTKAGSYSRYENRFLSQAELSGQIKAWGYSGILDQLQDAKSADQWKEAAAMFRSTSEKMDSFIGEKQITAGLDSPNGSMAAMEAALRGGSADKATEERARSTILDFYRAFRAAVTPLDVERRAVRMGLTWIENTWLGPREYASMVGDVQAASSPGQWKDVLIDYHRMQAAKDKFVKNPDFAPTQGPAAKLRYQGGLAAALAGFRLNHPNAKKIRAVFYADEQKTAAAASKDLEGIPLNFYLYREGSKWYLADQSTPHHEKVNKEAGPNDKAPLAELIAQVDSKLRFPKGMLEYEGLDGQRQRLVTTEPWRLTEWASSIGLVLALAGLAVLSGGTSVIATVFFVGAGVAGVVAAGADMAEKSKQGMLTTTEATVDVAMIVGTIATLGAGAMGEIAAIKGGETMLARLAPFAKGVYFPLTALSLGADSVALGAMTAQSWQEYEAIDKDKTLPPEERRLAHQRLAAMLLLQGGMAIISMKSQAEGLAGGKLKLGANKDGITAKVDPAANVAPKLVAKEAPMAILPNGKRIPPDHYSGGYHGTNEIPPELAFKEGLPERGTNWDLKAHAEAEPGSAYRGTTHVIYDPVIEQGAAQWAGEGGWVYEISGVPTWDVNKALQGRVPVAGGGFRGNLDMLQLENELAIPARVPPNKIKRAGQVELDSIGRPVVRKWIDNPNFGKTM